MNESFDFCLFEDNSNAFKTDTCSRLEANYSEMSHIEALYASNHQNTTKENPNPLCLEEDGLMLQKDILNEFNHIFHRRCKKLVLVLLVEMMRKFLNHYQLMNIITTIRATN